MVVPVGSGPASAPSPASEQGTLREVFSMQNNLALSIYRLLGVQLTVAERERVMQQPTQNVQALLAFGFGLEAEDRGRFSQAVTLYTRALATDPNFVEARTALERAQASADADDDSPGTLVAEGMVELLPPPPGLGRVPASVAAVNLRDRFTRIERLIPNPTTRDPVLEVLGAEGLNRRVLLNIRLVRPQ
jgi:hypothetical protein